MNDKLFKPRGLYCMIFAYKPDSKKAFVDMDPEHAINAGVAKRELRGGNKFGGPSGVAHDDLELPECAPLVFPQLDALPDEKKKGKVMTMIYYVVIAPFLVLSGTYVAYFVIASFAIPTTNYQNLLIVISFYLIYVVAVEVVLKYLLYPPMNQEDMLFLYFLTYSIY